MSFVSTPSQLSTVPASLTFGAGETWSPGVDVTEYLAAYPQGTTVTSPSASLVRLPYGTPVTLATGVVLVGNVILQKITSSEVSAGGEYQLTVKFTPSGTTDVLEAILLIVVPANS